MTQVAKASEVYSPSPGKAAADSSSDAALVSRIAILTGGRDKPYALGLATALTSHGLSIDVIGGDDLNVAQLLDNRRVNFLKLRDQGTDASYVDKVMRMLVYYWRLIRYAASRQPRLLHILWNNKFELFDRTLLMLYYKLMGKRIALTAHNVNIGKRDSNDSWLNRVSLKIQYGLSDHIFVHTEGMKGELLADFGIEARKVSVIPFGINNTVPDTSLSAVEAKRQVGVSTSDKTLLFFGNIAPYKGLENLVAAFAEVAKQDGDYRLVIVGWPKWNDVYWKQVQQIITCSGIQDRVIQRIDYIPDEQTELYFKAADVLILPYTHIFQSGVLFLSYSFGLPVIAADVGSLRDEIVEGHTGFVFKPRDSSDLAGAIRRYFGSELFQNLESRRAQIKAYADERYSWSKVAAITTAVYSDLLKSKL